jgi:hypothetical protein
MKAKQFIPKCKFSGEGCKGELELTDNSKTPTGLFTCDKCKSTFRANFTTVTNNFNTYKTAPIPLKQLKAKVNKTKKRKVEEEKEDE